MTTQELVYQAKVLGYDVRFSVDFGFIVISDRNNDKEYEVFPKKMFKFTVEDLNSEFVSFKENDYPLIHLILKYTMTAISERGEYNA